MLGAPHSCPVFNWSGVGTEHQFCFVLFLMFLNFPSVSIVQSELRTTGLDDASLEL